MFKINSVVALFKLSKALNVCVSALMTSWSRLWGSPSPLVSVVAQSVLVHYLSDKLRSAKNTLSRNLHFTGECG